MNSGCFWQAFPQVMSYPYKKGKKGKGTSDEETISQSVIIGGRGGEKALMELLFEELICAPERLAFSIPN